MFRLPHGVLFKSAAHAGEFVRRLHVDAAARRETDARCDLLFVRKEKDEKNKNTETETAPDEKTKAPRDTSFVDLGVYTRNRAFRLYLSSKHGKKHRLLPTGRFWAPGKSAGKNEDATKKTKTTPADPFTRPDFRTFANCLVSDPVCWEDETGPDFFQGENVCDDCLPVTASRVIQYHGVGVDGPYGATKSGSISLTGYGVKQSAGFGGGGAASNSSQQVRPWSFPKSATHCFTSNAGDCSDRLLRLFRPITPPCCPYIVQYTSNTRPTRDVNRFSFTITQADCPVPRAAKFVCSDFDGWTPREFFTTNASVRSWAACPDSGCVTFHVQGNRFCENAGRAHKSNNVSFTCDFREGAYYQRCHDPDCKTYKGHYRPLPDFLLPEAVEFNKLVSSLTSNASLNQEGVQKKNAWSPPRIADDDDDEFLANAACVRAETKYEAPRFEDDDTEKAFWVEAAALVG